MTSLMEPTQAEAAGPLAEALDDVRRSAQSLLADLGDRPKALRIRAGDVVVEMEWTHAASPPADAALPASAPASTPALPDTAAASTAAAAATGVEVCAPIVGTFYRAPEPGATPFVSEGDHVQRGQQVGIVEAMKLMIPVEADSAGRVTAVHVADGAPVEYGDPLLTIEPAAE